MKHRGGNDYLEVNDHRYRIHPIENMILRKRDPPLSLRTPYQVQNDTKIRKKQKVIRNDNDELEDKNCFENKKLPIQQQKFEPPNCSSCKRNKWLEFDKGYFCKRCEYNVNKQNIKLIKKVLRQDHYFSLLLQYANIKIGKLFYSIAKTTFNSTEDMIIKLQELKGKTN